MLDSIKFFLLVFLPPIITAFSSFLLAFIIARRTIRQVNKWKKGIVIFLASIEYLIIHILLFTIGIAVPTATGCGKTSECGWYMLMPMIGSFVLFPLGLIIFIIHSFKYLRKISLDISPKWSKKERNLFFIALVFYLEIILFLVPILNLTGMGMF